MPRGDAALSLGSCSIGRIGWRGAYVCLGLLTFAIAVPVVALWIREPLGLGLGTEIDLIAFLVTRYLGQRSFGELYGCFFMVFGVGSGLGRFFGGLVYDMAGSYTPALIGAAAALAVAVVCINRLGPYAYPAYLHIEPAPVAAAS